MSNAFRRVLGFAKREAVLALSLALALFGVLPPVGVAAAVAAFLLLADRELLRGVDYPLLGTFAALFIFTGNLSRLESFRTLLEKVLEGHVELAAVLASQVISNIPAALLLSGFTSSWRELIVGCNLGGLGTLIASMASLISFRFMAAAHPGRTRAYLLQFTLLNLLLLGLLLGLGALLGQATL